MDVGTETFETRYSRSRLRGLLVLPTALAVVLALAWWAGLLPSGVVVVLGALVVVLLLGLGLTARAALRDPLALRIDDAGLTLPGCPVVVWSDVEAVEVCPLRPTGAIGPIRLVGVVLPRPGSRLPRSALGTRLLTRWTARLRERTYGSPLVLPLFALEHDPETVVTAFGRHVAVRRLPVRRSPLALVLLVVGLALLAALIGLVLLAMLWMVV